MEEIVIDSEIANLIVQTYYDINALKNLFNRDPFLKLKELVESGITLQAILNSAIDKTSKEGLDSVLLILSNHLNNLSDCADIFQDVLQKHELKGLFEKLKIEVFLIQSKINAQS